VKDLLELQFAIYRVDRMLKASAIKGIACSRRVAIFLSCTYERLRKSLSSGSSPLVKRYAPVTKKKRAVFLSSFANERSDYSANFYGEL